MDKTERLEWLEGRKNYIGGSDIGCILGVNKFNSALDIYLSKTSDVVIDEPISQAAHWGIVLENTIIEEYSRVSGNTAIKPSGLITHPEYKHIAANIDGWVTLEDGTKCILECKTASLMKASEWGEQGTDQIPLSYLYQVAYYSAICGVDRVDIAVLIGGQDFRMYTYLKNEDLESKLIKAANAFWNNYIAKGIAPEATTQGDISTLYPNSNGETLEADDEITKEIEELKEIKEKEKELLKLKSDKETKIKACMGFKEAIIAGDGSLLATWKNGKSRKMLDTKKLKIENALIYQQYLNTKEASRMFLVK